MDFHSAFELGEKEFFASRQLDRDCRITKEFLEESKEDGQFLAVVAQHASNVARLAWGVKKDKEKCVKYFHISLDAQYWNYKTVMESGKHRVALDELASFEVIAPLKPHFLMHFASWHSGLERAAVFRRQDVIEELLKAPEAFLFGPGISWDDESYLDYRFMKAFWTDDPALPEIHRRLLEVLGPKKCESESALLNLQNYSLPMAELYGRIIHRDQEGFNEALVAALEGNIRMNLPNPEGDVNYYALVPTPIIAAAVIARDRGMQINIDTPYIPKWMLEGDF